MPQIEQLAETYSSQIFWLLIFFGLVFFVIGRGMVPKVMNTVAQRDTQIADDLAAAQAARDQANGQEEAWRIRENENRARAQGIIAQAKAVSATDHEARLAQAQIGVDSKLADAEARIAASRVEALAEVEAVAVDAAQDIVKRIANADVTTDSAQAAVKKALSHV